MSLRNVDSPAKRDIEPVVCDVSLVDRPSYHNCRANDSNDGSRVSDHRSEKGGMESSYTRTAPVSAPPTVNVRAIKMRHVAEGDHRHFYTVFGPLESVL